MTLWIIIGIVVLAVVVWACWPRRRGVNDSAAISGRRSSEGSNESVSPSIRNDFGPGGF